MNGRCKWSVPNVRCGSKYRVLTGTVHTHMSICQQVCTHISVILYYMMCTCSTTEILLQYDGEIPLLYLCFLYQNVVVSFLVHRYDCDQFEVAGGMVPTSRSHFMPYFLTSHQPKPVPPSDTATQTHQLH